MNIKKLLTGLFLDRAKELRELESLVKSIDEDKKCIWYCITEKDEELKRKKSPYHCMDCDGLNKMCAAYVPRDFYKK